jgi:stage II sporulation protein D
MSLSVALQIKFIKYSLIFLFSFIFLSCAPSRISRHERTLKKTPTPVVRILLNEPSPQFILNVMDDIVLKSDNKEVGKFRRGDVLKFSENNGLLLNSGNKRIRAKTFIIKPERQFSYSGKILEGDLLISSHGGKVYMVNPVSIEDYLKGVIPSEMPLGRGNEYYEALKAFAITARTFTLGRITASGGNIFDVRTDVRDQVYGGVRKVEDIAGRVVDDTKGLILTYNSEPASVFYSSTCGGKTEDVENVFGNVSIPYLKSITDGHPPYCSASPRASWEERFTGERIVNLLRQGGKINQGDYTLSGIKINSRFRSGKINEIEFLLNKKSGGKESVKLYGNNMRFVLLTGRNQALNSNNFEVVKSMNDFIFRGKGWGHGVGLCQWGALIQSTKGISYNKIINHYFPGTKITKYYD